ncbi:zf-TFIIB domain-containing protein [Paenibacillus sp. sgz302251]|uniref:TFIIB-type zinc ribbon-containing protein n=1 Tax=Paenibacillus sp. sgz302251 TaxID=3414493 RepID=UPI003C7E0F41
MKCPVCEDVRMREVLKDDVLIDVCPDCKGVWLDRGELDKLMQGVRDMQQQLGSYQQPPAGGAPYGNSQQGGYGNQQPGSFGAPQGGPGYGTTPPPVYGSGQGQGQQGYGNQGYGHNKHGYDKYGRPYKKKKTVLDVFGDLFD